MRISSMLIARSLFHISSSAANAQLCFLEKAELCGSGLDLPGMLFMLRDVRRGTIARQRAKLTMITDDDEQVHPAGRHVPQTSGEPSQGIPAWIAANPEGSLDNTDVVLWHTFGITHFPSPEGMSIPFTTQQLK